jgi:hypothetical protein
MRDAAVPVSTPSAAIRVRARSARQRLQRGPRQRPLRHLRRPFDPAMDHLDLT